MVFAQETGNQPEEMEMEMMSSTSPPEKSKHKSASPDHQLLAVPATSNQLNSTNLASPADSPCKAEKNGHPKDSANTAKTFEIQSMPNGKTRTSLKTMSMSKRKISQQKEKKATQMLAIVLGESQEYSHMLFNSNVSFYFPLCLFDHRTLKHYYI